MKLRKIALSLLLIVSMMVAMTGTALAEPVTDEAGLAAALAAGGEIVIGSDIVVTNGMSVPSGKTVTLDLNGHTVSLTRDGTLSAYDQLIENNGVLTIEDSVGGGALEYQYVGSTVSTGFAATVITNKPGATLTVKGGTIENKTTTSHTTYAIDTQTNGKVGGKDTNLIIEGGTVKSVKGEGRGVAVRACLNSTTYSNNVTISGDAVVEGGYGGLQVHSISSSAVKADINVDGGTLNGEYALYSYFSNKDTSNVDITITDGELNGYTFLYNHNKGSDQTPFSASIEGGEFNGGVYVYTTDANDAEVSTPCISGGSFSEDPDDSYIVPGEDAVKIGDRWYLGSYIVTYTDGVDGEEIFADQVITAGNGAETPAFNGTPTRTGYTFEGWSPAVASTVTADATYTAQWKAVAAAPTTAPTATPVPNSGATAPASTPAPVAPAPKTGDNTNVVALSLLMVAAFIGIVVLSKKRAHN